MTRTEAEEMLRWAKSLNPKQTIKEERKQPNIKYDCKRPDAHLGAVED
jgi:hypothetical protein